MTLREKIAILLQEIMPDILVNPHDIWIQNPRYASKQYDCARWGVYGVKTFEDGTIATVGFSSWYKMSDLVKTGIEVYADGSSLMFTVDPKE